MAARERGLTRVPPNAARPEGSGVGQLCIHCHRSPGQRTNAGQTYYFGYQYPLFLHLCPAIIDELIKN
jgi:hypothetical protein